MEVPGYTFRLFVTNLPLSGEEIWRDYNHRADMENRIAELKHDLAADDLCLREFFATEAAFRSILLLFNLFGGIPARLPLQHLSAARHTAHPSIPLWLGRACRSLVLQLFASWGGLKPPIPLLENVLAYPVPTSPKLHPEPAT